MVRVQGKGTVGEDCKGDGGVLEAVEVVGGDNPVNGV